MFFIRRWIVRVLGRTGWFSVQGMLPKSRLEVAVWVVMAASGAICEETIYRGYLQRQLSGWRKGLRPNMIAHAIIDISAAFLG